MRKFTKLLLTLAMLFGAVGVNSVKAGKTNASFSAAVGCTWSANTMGFTAVNGWQILLTGLPNGDITSYTKFHATLSSMSDNITNVRLRIKDTSEKYADVNLVAGENNVDLAALATANPTCNFKAISDITIWSPTSAAEGKTVDGDNPASVVITDCYLYMPPTLVFDVNGKAVINKDDLSATGGLTYDASTGALSSDGTEGTLVLEFASPVDLKYLNFFKVKRDGDDSIIDKLYFYEEDGTEINNWGYTKFDNTWRNPGCDDNATKAFLNHNPVKKLVWKSPANAENKGKTLTINSIEWTLKTISCAKAGETQLKTLDWNKIDGSGTATPNWNMNGTSDTYYGDYSGNATHYADLSDYSELRVYCESNSDGFRAFFIKPDKSGTNTYSTSNATWHATEKYYSLDLSTVEKWDGKIALKSIKSDPWSGTTTGQNVTNIVVYKTPAANAPQYTLTGSGMQLAETVAALADANATCIDAMGVIGNTTNSEAGRTLLTSANPNCLFLGKVGDGYLANTKNVVDGDVCANLELTDAKPFKAPVDFTATNAKFTKTVGAAEYATMVIPFAAALPSGVEAYNITDANDDTGVLTFTPAESIAADAPVLLKNAGTYEFSATGVEIAATEGTVRNSLLKGAYTATTAAASPGNYVLQNNADGVNFYLVTDIAATVPPFRAYLSTDPTGAARTFYINLDEATAIDAVQTKAEQAENGEVYNLAGQRVAQPQKGLYIVNGKKVIVK